MKKLLLTSAIFLISLGILLRATEVINGNYVFGFDHGREYLMTRDIVDYHHFRLIGTPLGAGSAGIQGIFHGPLYYYFLAIPYVLFNGDPYGGVVLMFVIGLLSLTVGYFLGKRLFGFWGAIFFLLLLSLCPPLIAQSRFIWSPYPSTLFILLSFYSLFRIKDGKKWVFLSGFFPMLIYHFEFAIAVPMTIGAVIYAAFLFRNKNKINYLYILGGIILASLPMILFEVRHNFMAVNGMLTYLKSGGSGSSVTSFLANQSDHLKSFSQNFFDAFPSPIRIPSLLTFFAFIAAIFALLKNLKNKNKSYFYYLLAMPIITFFVLMFLRNTVYHYYLYHVTIIYLILFSAVLSGVSRKNKKIGYLIPFALILSISILYSVPAIIKTFSYDVRDYGGDAKIRGKLEAINYIYKDAGSTKFGLLIFTPPVYTYPYEYIIYWKGRTEHRYVPPFEKRHITYLLMEVDHDKPWSYKGWLETVIKDGLVVAEKKLPSGIIIQKRIYNNLQ